MAYASIHSSPSFERTSSVLRAVGDFLLLLVTSGPRIAALEQLNQTPDSVLEAKGTTRNREIQRILGPRSLL